MPYNPFHNRPDEWEMYDPLVGTTMLELGGKINAPQEARGYSEADKRQYTYKVFFEAMGIEHISLDWNGMHGSISRDLRKPLWDEFGQFDMVANFGTTEHVDGQAGVWENVHRMTKQGGVYVGLTPYPGGESWYWHGEYFPTEGFFESFAELNGWEIEKMHQGREIPHRNLYVRMRKISDGDFIMPDEDLIYFNRIRPR